MTLHVTTYKAAITTQEIRQQQTKHTHTQINIHKKGMYFHQQCVLHEILGTFSGDLHLLHEMTRLTAGWWDLC